MDQTAVGAGFIRSVPDRAFAKARSHLHMPALNWLNDWVLERADVAAMVPRWRGLRLVAADAATVLMPAIRACHRTRSPASANQRLFMLYLPAAELTLHADVHSAATSERAMLVEALDKLRPDDLLLLDRGYPPPHPRSVSSATSLPNGRVRVLATNLDAADFPCESFGDLYHARWRIEEAFKRLKHRYHLEATSGLSQQALIVDVAAKVLADNLASLMCLAAQAKRQAATPAATAPRRCNRNYAAHALSRMLPSVLLFVGDISACISNTIDLLARTTKLLTSGRSTPRPYNHVKPHPRYAYKG